jgi:hypothetical protein
MFVIVLFNCTTQQRVHVHSFLVLQRQVLNRLTWFKTFRTLSFESVTLI